ncbi:MAG: metal-sulfur cluster assembly factor [Candidatus Bipolaricaulota bacterium]
MPTAGQVRAVLRGVMDPELGINVVDLGLIYGVRVERERILVEMTFTTPTCPLTAALSAQVEQVLREKFADHDVEVTLVWEPHWTPEMMSEDVRRQLGAQ